MHGRAVRTAAVAAFAAASTFSSPGTPATAQQPAPVGMVAYASNVDGDYEIYVMNADGSDVRQLTFNDVDDFEPAWSPTGGRIVFERERSYDGYEDLYIVGVNRGVERLWIRSRGIDEGDAAWSPGGQWIAFRGSDWGDGADVVALRVDRSKVRYVAAQAENSTNSDPAWSPDGKRVAHVESYEGAGVYVASFCCSHGSRKRELYYSSTWKYDLDWSPDGSCIVYSQSSGVRTVTVAGGDPRWVHRSTSAAGSSWSPDGSSILFHDATAGSFDLYTVSPDGTGLIALTETPDVDEITPEWWAPPVAEPHTPDCGAPPVSPTPAPA